MSNFEAPKNRAFLFIKPNAATPAMEKLVEATLAAKGIKILQKGVIDGPTIDAIGWNMGEMAPQIKQNTPIDLAFTLVKNTWKPRGWQNRTELNLHLRAIQPASAGS